MGFHKAKFDEDIEALSRFARGLSLPVRLLILKVLISKAAWTSHEAFDDLDLTPVTRDRHLRALIDLGLVEDIHKRGVVYYQINEANFNKMEGGFLHFFAVFKNANIDNTSA